MGAPRVTDAGDAGRVSGLLVGLLQGAGVGAVFIPVPIVGSFVGAVVGGMVGTKAGRYVGDTMDKGGAAAKKSATIIAVGTAASLRRPKPSAKKAPAQPAKAAPKPLILVDAKSTSVETTTEPAKKGPAAARPASRTRTGSGAEGGKTGTGASEKAPEVGAAPKRRTTTRARQSPARKSPATPSGTTASAGEPPSGGQGSTPTSPAP